jgi:surface carbohydrate biosynthesis protein (TIGR04326 family)
MFCGLDVADFLIDCLNRDYESNEVNKNFIYYYYIKGFLRNIKAGTFIFTFENQAWEKISVAAVRRYSRSTKIIGYAHTSIRPSMLGYFCSKEEEAALSLPDKIITIGREPKLILQMSGNYKDERRIKVSEGCALRYEYLFNKNRIGWNRAGKILAVLSIDTYYSMRLLRFLCDSLGANDKYSVILRSHPFTPAEIIMEKFNIMPKNNFIISKNLRLEEDMEGAALIIYVDTTSSIEALLCGIPAVCVDLKEPINPDPLFKLNKLKWTIFDKPSLINTVDHIYNMDEVEYEKNYKDAVMYLKDYFYPVEEKYLEEFII